MDKKFFQTAAECIELQLGIYREALNDERQELADCRPAEAPVYRADVAALEELVANTEAALAYFHSALKTL